MSQTGQSYTFAGQLLTCPICKQSSFEQESTLLHHEEDAQTPTDTYLCTICGYMLWFSPAEVDAPGQAYLLLNRPLQCAMCAHTLFHSSEILLNTRTAIFMQFNWATHHALNYICAHCGFIKWFFTEEVARPGKTYHVAHRQLTCQSCTRIAFRERETLLSSKSPTFPEADWTDQSTKNYICTTCGSIHWFVS
ncbi:hypothetical protein [Tengunoibacter tsumagoiensis]|uniref:Uncharacterized protein n=1 Tax=Tengunoibacter tsumagoiensis TaxID=2014871 RepID=A0A402A0G5_9CHLR|nr:hypothetical protein [Tengunoibacter tsumagoiensis]GCE12640.1 hypothetical protein KTT_24990 [Tengunoibacter tsumagoiensis]